MAHLNFFPDSGLTDSAKVPLTFQKEGHFLFVKEQTQTSWVVSTYIAHLHGGKGLGGVIVLMCVVVVEKRRIVCKYRKRRSLSLSPLKAGEEPAQRPVGRNASCLNRIVPIRSL